MFQMKALFNIRKWKNQSQAHKVYHYKWVCPCTKISQKTEIEAQSSGSKEGQKGQETEEQVPEGMVVPTTWPPSLVYGITPSVSLDDDKHQQLELKKQTRDEKKDVEVSLAEFLKLLGDSVVQVSPVVGSDRTRKKSKPHWEGKDSQPHSRIHPRGEVAINSFIWEKKGKREESVSS